MYFSLFIVGGAIGWLASTVLFEAWFALGWGKPVANWFVVSGVEWLAAFWWMVWVNAVDFIVFGMAATIVGVLAKRRWLVKLIVMSLGFVVTPWGWSIVSGFNPFMVGGRILTLILLQKIALVAMGVAVSLLARRIFVRRKKQEGFPVTMESPSS